MSLVAYAASKVAVLGALTALECAFLAWATMLPQNLPALDPVNGLSMPKGGLLLGAAQTEIMLDVVLAGLAAMMVALLVSAVVRTSDQANFAMPLLLVAQIVLSAPVLSSPGPVFETLGTVSTAQWGIAAASSTISLNDIRKPYMTAVEDMSAPARGQKPDQKVIDGKPSWNHDLGEWSTDVLALVAIALASMGALFGALVIQMRLQPQVREPAT
jgi:hypothetical protein